MYETIERLQELESAPKTVSEWFDRHRPEVQSAILVAVRDSTASKAKIAKILRADADNPLPFKDSAFNAWVQEITQ